MRLCDDSFIRRTNDSFGQKKKRKRLHRLSKVREELICSVLTEGRKNHSDDSKTPAQKDIHVQAP